MAGEGGNSPSSSFAYARLTKGINMTLRELLKSLQAQSEKSLDAPVVVSPPSGRYRSISHISALYTGPVVIHLSEAPKLTDAGRELFETLKNFETKMVEGEHHVDRERNIP